MPLLYEILGNMSIAILGKPGCDVMNFEVNLIFLIKPFFVHDQSRDKKLNILRTKRGAKINQKTFSITFKGLSIKQITQIFLESESLTLSEVPLNFDKVKKQSPRGVL